MRVVILPLLLLPLAKAVSDIRARKTQSEVPSFKNVIVLIPDGCDDAVVSFSKWYKQEKLFVETMSRTMMRNTMANSIITDSAPGGTALASGLLTTDNFIGVGPRTSDLLSIYPAEDMFTPYAPFANVVEAAKLKGLATGLVTTSRLSHATPAAYSTHVHERYQESLITKQQVFQNINVMMGGGENHLLPGPGCPNGLDHGLRTDCLNLRRQILERGYNFCTTKDQMDRLPDNATKVWCSFARSHMQPDMNRKYFAPQEPSLAEMAKKAIDILSQDENGFFLMVESAQVDWAGHANDPVWAITDFIAFDDAVKVAVEFAEEDGETLVLALPDHNCGGMKLSNYRSEYVDKTPERTRDPFLKMTMTSEGVVAMMRVRPEEATADDIKDVVSKYWGIELTDEDTNDILTYSELNSELYESNPLEKLPLNHGLCRIVSERYTEAGWTSHGHSGELVPLWVYGMTPPTGTIDNTEVAKITAAALGLDLEATTKRLFIDLDDTGLEYKLALDTPGGPRVLIGNATIVLHTDVMYNSAGDKVMMPGIAVFAEYTQKVYVSQDAIDAI